MTDVESSENITPTTPAWLTWLADERNTRLVRAAIAKRVGARDFDDPMIDDAWDEVVLERLARIHETHDPARGASLLTHTLRSIAWYAHKWAVKRSRDASRARGQYVADDDDSEASSFDQLADIEQAERVGYRYMDHLTEQALSSASTEVLVMRYVLDMTYEEIARVLCVSRNVARARVEEALSEARREMGVNE